jgi:hypothetical protein
MKTVYPLLITCILGIFTIPTIAQPICGFDSYHQKLLATDPLYNRNVDAANQSIQNYLQLHPELMIRRNSRKVVTSGTPQILSAGYQIPVVVHVIHTGGDVGSIYNPTDDQIHDAISYLNQVYNGSWPGTVTTGYGAGDLGIQFVLAQRDPNCNPTNGINRIDGSGVSGYASGGVNQASTLGTSDINIKNLSRWDNSKYYNIWIVNKIDGNDGTHGQFIAGYAALPPASPTADGIVMLATQMVAGQKTLPHEIGHAFGLYHPFQGSTQTQPCVSNSNCNTQGDLVCDTDPISYNINYSTGAIDFSCRAGTNSCTGNPYTAATESNYMNYTNCYTLFTPGQAARMQAFAVSIYRSSLTTSLGGAPPDNACGPKVDFELQGDRQTEATTATIGCRGYKDYTYNMVIGVGPSATATATITVTGGAAVQGIDFDLTTNGNFTSPSQQLSFPAGSTTAQPFTIRIYDDASVNGTRNAVLGFTVNNGGGNAVAGDGRPAFTLTIDDNDKAPSGPGTATASIGADTYTISSPFTASQPQYKTQVLYYASELTAQGLTAGNLTGLAFYVDKNSNSSFVYQGLTIKLGLTTQPAAYSGSPLADGGFITVYSNNYSTVNGWNTFNFAAPFAWDGASNLAIEVCYNNGTSTDNDDYMEGYADGSGKTNTLFSPVSCGAAFGSLNGYGNSGIKPILQLLYPSSGTAIQSPATTSQSLYLGPNADVYFYDQTSGKLMTRIQNLSSFDYGCTQVAIDRAGTNTTPFWNNNATNYLMDKTFHVNPATNNSSGNYNITFYYTQAEVQGWQSATGQTLSSIQLVKVPGQISSVTPSDPTAAGSVTIVTPSIGTLGSNTALTYNFTTGFSGFGAGVPSLTDLPVTLLQFTGRLDNNNAILSWSTSFEQNSAGFEVDRSFDGQHFTKVGYVTAAGNSTTQKDYSFTDPSLTTDSNYYQLKETTLDGRESYSKVILIRNPHVFNGFIALPNPFTTDLDLIFHNTPANILQVRLLDITGRELWRQVNAQADGNRLHLGVDGTHLAAGIYLVEVRSATGVEIQRVIKK